MNDFTLTNPMPTEPEREHMIRHRKHGLTVKRCMYCQRPYAKRGNGYVCPEIACEGLLEAILAGEKRRTGHISHGICQACAEKGVAEE